jgi:hypothetical protein
MLCETSLIVSSYWLPKPPGHWLQFPAGGSKDQIQHFLNQNKVLPFFKIGSFEHNMNQPESFIPPSEQWSWLSSLGREEALVRYFGRYDNRCE